jgi:hypothetical protein
MKLAHVQNADTLTKAILYITKFAQSAELKNTLSETVQKGTATQAVFTNECFNITLFK